MEALILDKNFEAVSVMDTFQSFIWTERYDTYGDFEIYASVNTGLLNHIMIGSYIQKSDSDNLMVVEQIEITADHESGDFVTVSGRSLESILERRIIWKLTTLTGNLQNGVEKLLTENIINPEDPNRKISNFIFERSDDQAITSLTIEAQFTGDNLLQAITDICALYNIGFKISMNDSKQFVFKLYAGKDRSYAQTENPYVTFSSDYDNILSSNYMESNLSYKNVALVGGEGEGLERRYASIGTAAGLERREVFVDARDISSDKDDGTQMSDSEYKTLLTTRGENELKELSENISFEGEMDTRVTFTYGKDFFMGDVVQVVDKYGNQATSRVTEIVQSHDENGYAAYPTLSNPKLVE